MKFLNSVLFSLFVLCIYADTNVITNTKRPKRTGSEIRALITKYEGGKLYRPGTFVGQITFINCQKDVPLEWVKVAATNFQHISKIRIVVNEGTFSFPSPKLIGNASLFVVNDPMLPSLLVAPENKWAMVNVSLLKSGLGSQMSFFYSRVQKELLRGACLLSGAQRSNYPMSLLGCVTKPEDLDSFVDCRLPIDIPARFDQYVDGYGITIGKMTTYRRACQEGWAPMPTNNIQKAIWEKVHALPKNPIKIEFDPKKGR